MEYIDSTDEIAQEEEIISESIHISGDVHQGSIIDSNQLLVSGTTHKGSTQFSKYADIHTHQGLLRCHEASIKFLDTGEVHATTVNIDTATSASIYAQDVSINNLGNDVKIYASNSITINSINGKNNHLSIDYTSIPILISKIELIAEDIKDLELSLYKARKDHSFLEVEIETEITNLKKSLFKIKNSTKTAKISIKDIIKEINYINFKIDDTHNISCQTQKLQYSPFYLQYQEDTITLHPTQTSITKNS